MQLHTLLIGAFLVGLAGCSQAPRAHRELLRVEIAPAEMAILVVENQDSRWGTDADFLREALAAAAVDAGFSPLGRDFVDQAKLDLDVPALGNAGVLRVRLRDWEPLLGPPTRLSGRVHASLYQGGELLADLQYSLDYRSDAAEAAADAPGQMAALRRQFAVELIGKLPPPPKLGENGAR
jgi:hypothetical protein